MNKSIIVVCVILVIIIIAASLLIINNSQKGPIYYDYIVSNNDSDLIIEVPNDNGYGKFELASLDSDNVTRYVTPNEIYSDDMTIEGVVYKSINSVLQEDYELDSSLYNIDNDEDLFKEDLFIYDFEEDSKLFRKDKEILPKKLFLCDVNQKAFYKYQGVTYYIPIELASSKNEERIEYRDYGLTIMKNTGEISAFGKDIKTNYHVDSIGKIDDDLSSLFECYYLLKDNDDIVYKVYETDLDNDDSTKEIYFTSIDASISETALSKLILKSTEDRKVYKCVVPSDVLGNIKYFKNVFYCNSDTNLFNLNKISNEYIPFTYYKFENDGFVKKSAFKNIDIKQIEGKYITLNKDYNYTDYNLDGKYNELISGDKITYVLTANDNSESFITKGSKLEIFKVLSSDGNAILKNYSGDLYLISND